MGFSVGIVGFRHGHIQDLVTRIQGQAELSLVAVCEEHEATRAAVEAQNLGVPVYSSYSAMLDAVSLDIVAVGDAFGLRGGRVIEALERGSHVIGDKPLCTRRSELETIKKLAQEKSLCVGCMLDLRDSANFAALRNVVQAGSIGEVSAISFGGQHPLLPNTRPSWYFDVDLHGGTLNDVGIHAFDLIPWITGLEFAAVETARVWNPMAPQHPHFQSAAQVTLTLSNGAGVQGDVSYLVPDSFGYVLPQYWRTTIWGTKGVAETQVKADGVSLYRAGASAPELVTAPATPGGYLQAFLNEIAGKVQPGAATTASNLRTQEVSILIQEAADQKLVRTSLI